jgi:CO/xanthine dehydrogenase FAD-binding subunit
MLTAVDVPVTIRAGTAFLEQARRALRPETDAFASAAYRAHLAGVLARRALSTAVDRARSLEAR